MLVLIVCTIQLAMLHHARIMTEYAAYTAAHAGLTGLAKALIGPLGRRGIQVSLVLADPGDVSGSMSRILEAAVERPD